MNQSTEITNNNISSTTDMVLNHQAMAQMQQLATLMCNGVSTVPKHLQGNAADCMAIVMQAAQWKMNPYAVAQKTHLVGGALGYEAQLVNAVISSSKAIKGRFHYEYGGNWEVTGGSQTKSYQQQQAGQNVNDGTSIDPTCWVRVGAILAGENQITWGEPLYPSTVGVKNSSLWKTNPKQQSAYLATKYWARLYAPAVILGVYSTDELEPVAQQEKDITPTKTVNEETGEIILPEYPQANFDVGYPKWNAAIQSGKKTQDEIITMITSKYSLTEEQIEMIKSIPVGEEA